MSLSLLTFGLLCARSVQAQGPGGWQLDHYEANGATQWSDGGGAHSESWIASASGVSNRIIYGNPCQSTGTVSAVFTWQGGGQPASEIFLLITSHVNAAGTPSSTPSNNGFGDPGGTYDENGSAGTHLVHIINSSHDTTIKTSVYNLSAICGSHGYTTYILFQAAVDTSKTPRSVTITSSLGQTNHKGSQITDNGTGQIVPDLPDAAGTINANTLKPTSQSNFDGSSTDITYYAHPAGSWAADSSYHWNIVEGDGGTNPTDGTFTMPGDPPYSEGVGYYTGSIVGGPEHVYIHLTDAGDGANATANYYVNWHDPVEKWHSNGSSFSMPPTCYGDSKVSQPAGGQDTVEIDVPPGKVSATAGDKTLGGVITTGAAVVAVAFPETDPVIIGLLTAAGYTLSVEPDPADQSYKVPGPESQFKADVATQVAINNGNTSGVFRPDLPRMAPDLANAISQSGDYDDYFNGKYGKMSFGVQIFQLQWSQNYLGDAYGVSGYTGDATGVVNWPGAIPPADYVFNWTKVTPPSS